MKKTLILLTAAILILSFAGCSKSEGSKGEAESTQVSTTSASQSKDGNPNTTENPVTAVSSEAERKKSDVKISGIRNDETKKVFEVYEKDAEEIKRIVSSGKFEIGPYDNINNVLIEINSKEYYYDSLGGILTYSDENTKVNEEMTAQLNDEERNLLNKTISHYFMLGLNDLYGMDYYSSLIPTEDYDIIEDTFIIKEVNGTSLILNKYDPPAEETENSLYTCDYGELDGSDMMRFDAGDIVSIKYDRNIMETYPMQITIHEIVDVY